MISDENLIREIFVEMPLKAGAEAKKPLEPIDDEEDPSLPSIVPDVEPLTPLWSGFNFKPHQLVGVNWLKERETMVPFGGILCDEMGLGKTIQVISLVKEDASKTHSLLIAPVAVLDQWEPVRCVEIERLGDADLHQ